MCVCFIDSSLDTRRKSTEAFAVAGSAVCRVQKVGHPMCKCYAIKMYGGVKVKLREILTSELDRGEIADAAFLWL
jgi:hypothetical protein